MNSDTGDAHCHSCVASGRVDSTHTVWVGGTVDGGGGGGGSGGDEGGWTAEETVELLRAVEACGGSDWQAVATAVGRTPHECVTKFLRLPVEEGVMEETREVARGACVCARTYVCART